MKFPSFAWQSPNAADLQHFIIVVSVLAATIVVWTVLSALVERRRGLSRLLKIAAGKAEGRGLTPEERKLWERLVVETGAVPSLHVFERHVAELVKKRTRPAVIHGLRMKLGYRAPKGSGHLESTRECQAGTRIRLSRNLLTWPAVIIGVDELHLTVRLPATALNRVKEGDAVDVFFRRDEDGTYHFRTVVARIPGTRAFVVLLAHPEQIERGPLVRPPEETATAVELRSAEGRAEGQHLVVHPLELTTDGFHVSEHPRLDPNERMDATIPLRHVGHVLKAPVRVARTGPGGVRFEFEKLPLQDYLYLGREVRLQKQARRGLR